MTTSRLRKPELYAKLVATATPCKTDELVPVFSNVDREYYRPIAEDACLDCPLFAACGEYADANREWGVWGGKFRDPLRTGVQSTTVVAESEPPAGGWEARRRHQRAAKASIKSERNANRDDIVRTLAEQGYPYRAIAEVAGCSKSSIRRILTGQP